MVVAVALAAVLAGCSGGGNGGDDDLGLVGQNPADVAAEALKHRGA